MNINQFLESLAANSSRNFKRDQLEANKDNELLREVIRLALCPFTQFYQRKIPAYTPNTTGHPASLASMLPALYDLRERLVTGNAAIDHLINILQALSPDDAKVMERIIQKDLKCGVQASTANDVWMGLVHEYPVMLCSPFEQKLVDKIQFPAYAQLKMDGMRFNAIVRDGKVEFRSRNGKEIQLLGNLEKEFAALAGDVDCVFDGELLVMDPDDYQFMDRQTGNGILNKANKGTISAKEAAMVHATVWDVIPYVLFETGYCGTPYSTRFSSLKLLVDKQPSENKKIWIVTSDIVETMEEAQTIFEGYLAQGLEGIILKDGAGVWEDKRAKHQIKFKGELECDLKIVAIEEGTGKYAGMLGAILCESADGVIKVRVGSGFTDEQRKTLGEEIIDKIAAIKYNTRIKNKAGEESLFLPIILEIRDDKEVADTSSVIK
jgi:ATP dependent DNA ligase domain/DNA ligase OB-like domain